MLGVGSYRFYFYSHEPNEPPHIHIDRDCSSAKFWLDAVSLANNIMVLSCIMVFLLANISFI
ncbi:MAG: DUF4160 domain-containing protein [Cyanobacteria bacterium SBLK]|nr:DUF4160 domain-containing protein [Cyanobacteria bacterium SBLK]